MARRYATQFILGSLLLNLESIVFLEAPSSISMACLTVGGLEGRCLNTIDASPRLAIQSRALPTQDKII